MIFFISHVLEHILTFQVPRLSLCAVIKREWSVVAMSQGLEGRLRAGTGDVPESSTGGLT